MALVTAATGDQLGAIAHLRWRLFVNSLRTNAGRFELGARVFMGLMYGIVGTSIAIGLGAGAYALTSRDQVEWLAILFWAVLVLWQMLPIILSSFGESVDPSSFLRFPLTYPLYFFTLIVYGLFDVATALGSLCLGGIILGSSAARPGLLLPLTMIGVVFAATNVLLSRTIFAWIDRWLARRRSREILGGVFFLLLMSLQAITPLSQRIQGRSAAHALHSVEGLNVVQRMSPPGLAGGSVAAFARGELGESVLLLAGLSGYAVAFALLLSVRLRAQFRGESLGETRASTPVRAGAGSRPLFGGSTGPMAAIVEKETRYLMRSGPVLFTLIVPVFLLIVFGNSSRSGGGNMQGMISRYGFPMGIAYVVLMLTNFLYNSFGSDAAGAQFYFASGVPIRRVALAKNAFYCGVALVEVVLVLAAVSLLFEPPTLAVICGTLAWLIFVMPLNLGIGNLFSLIAPRRTEVGNFGRQKPKTVSALAAVGVQAVTIGLGVLVLTLTRSHGLIWAATPIFLLLAVGSAGLYRVIYLRLDRLALDKQDQILAELCRS